MRNFVLFDIHGNIKALKQVLERSGFDYERDKLVTIGDICDGWRYVYECVEELLKIKNRVDVRGNHDQWFYHWIETGVHPQWWEYGGKGTLISYAKAVLGDSAKYMKKVGDIGWVSNLNPGDIPESHKAFFRRQHFYYIDEDNNLFVHGGFDRHLPIRGQDPKVLMWDRSFWESAMSFGRTDRRIAGSEFKTADNFNHIYIGHTSTENWFEDERNSNGIIIKGKKPIRKPMIAGGGIVTNGDTGAGWNGPLTIICTDNGEFWQSDTNLYPGEKGR